MKILFLFVLYGVLITISEANENNVTLFESKITGGETNCVEINIGFVLEEETKIQICTFTALTNKWFIMTATCLMYIMTAQHHSRPYTYSLYLADAHKTKKALTEISIGETKYCFNEERVPEIYKGIDIAIFKAKKELRGDSFYIYSYDDIPSIDPSIPVKIVAWKNAIAVYNFAWGEEFYTTPNKDDMAEIEFNIISVESCRELRKDYALRDSMVCTAPGSRNKYLEKVDVGAAVVQGQHLLGIVIEVPANKGPAIILETKFFPSIPALYEALHPKSLFKDYLKSLKRP